MTNEELIHYGIIGMKWGKRRYQYKDGSLTPEGRKRYADDNSDDYNKAHSPKSVKSMSDAELKARLNRLNMEKQYKQLTANEVSGGRKFVQDVLVNAAKQTATTYVSKYMTKGVDYLIDKTKKK